MLRCGSEGVFPHLMPGTRCFLSYGSALFVLQEYQAAGQTATLFTVQDRVGVPFGSTPSPGCQLPDEFDPRILRLLDYNFCTLVRIGDEIVWEWMDSGYGVSDLDCACRVHHSKRMPSRYHGHPVWNVYCVTPSGRGHIGTKPGSPIWNPGGDETPPGGCQTRVE
jgi:hypothetical protein